MTAPTSPARPSPPTSAIAPDAARPLTGWGRYPRVPCVVQQTLGAKALAELVGRDDGQCFIARGLGRSYGDAALSRSGVVLDQTGRDRFLSFDPGSGVLRCEAGVSLASVLDVFVPRGWVVPVLPGTKHVTVGGAIAADVHGKNHHVDGSFGSWVRGLSLLLASGETLTCAPDREPEAFWATVGGMGLTGIILTADIQLIRTSSAYVRVRFTRTGGLDETLGRLVEGDRHARYSVAWVDALARGAKLGRGVLMLADDASPDALGPGLVGDPLRSSARTRLSVPFTPPLSLVARPPVRLFNALYYAAHRGGERVMSHDAFFYPLDRIAHWNRIYGPRGFIQHQALLPPETAAAGLHELLEQLSRVGAASFLSVLKRTGPGSGGMLSFPRAGYTLALDIPHPRGGFERLTHELDQIVLRHGGRVYLAKDATLTPSAFREMYPDLDRFLAVKRRLDPHSRFASEQSRRLGITADATGAAG